MLVKSRCGCTVKQIWGIFDPCMLGAEFPDYLHGWPKIRCWLWRFLACMEYNIEDIVFAAKARLAQMVEQSPRKAQVGGSIPSAGSKTSAARGKHEM